MFDDIPAGSRIQVIDRAAALLDAIARYPAPVSLKVLGAETGLHPSTAHRILGALIHNHLVEKDNAGRYRLGLRLLQLGVRLHGDVDMRAIARPVMEELHTRMGETVNLTIRDGDEVVYIDTLSPDPGTCCWQLIGSRAPLHVTAVGKLMLAAGGEDCIRAYARRTNLPAYTRNSITALPRLIAACQAALAQGFALDEAEAEAGAGCIGVLLHDSTGKVAGGLSISAPLTRRRLEWAEDLVAAGRCISAQLGWQARNAA
ncbi:MAG: IclR family transcriptional regulator [Chromatiaceae bacterium]|nr:MAG: IclR family transcriptional regulator [Chromatiaceae bacterium]